MMGRCAVSPAKIPVRLAGVLRVKMTGASNPGAANMTGSVTGALNYSR